MQPNSNQSNPIQSNPIQTYSTQPNPINRALRPPFHVTSLDPGECRYQVRVTPLIISAFNVVLPVVFSLLSYWEEYLTEITRSRVNVARSYVVKMASLYVLLFGFVGIDQSTHTAVRALGPVDALHACQTPNAIARRISVQRSRSAGRRRSAKSFTPSSGPPSAVRSIDAFFWLHQDQRAMRSHADKRAPTSLTDLRRSCGATARAWLILPNLSVSIAVTLASSFGFELFYYVRKRARHSWTFDISGNIIELLYLQAIVWYTIEPLGDVADAVVGAGSGCSGWCEEGVGLGANLGNMNLRLSEARIKLPR